MLTSINGESLLGRGHEAVRQRIERLDLTTQRGALLEFTVARDPSQHAVAATDSSIPTHVWVETEAEAEAHTEAHAEAEAAAEAAAEAEAQSQALAKVSGRLSTMLLDHQQPPELLVSNTHSGSKP